MTASTDVDRLSREAMTTCACQGLRRSTRRLTRWYDQAMTQSGVRITQLPILVALNLQRHVSLGELAEALDMDRTTLTRNLRPLRDQGWVSVARGSDRRVSLLSLTPEGREALGRALELWEQVQSEVRAQFGAARLDRVLTEVAALAGAIGR